MNNCKSPKDKLLLINNCCFILLNIKNKSKFKCNIEVELQDLVIVCLVKCSVKDLYFNIEFVRLYRHKCLFTNEEDYFMSLIEIGIEYIKNVDLDQLTINQAGLNGLGSFDGSYDSSNNDFKENEIEFSNIDSFGLNNSELDMKAKPIVPTPCG